MTLFPFVVLKKTDNIPNTCPFDIFQTIFLCRLDVAGGVLGMKKTMANYEAGKDKKLIIVTVGLANILGRFLRGFDSS